MTFAKIPPQARDEEAAVLGAIMLEKSAFDIVSEILKPESFYVDAHQRIFSAMMSLVQKSSPIDLLTVVQELKSREELDVVGGPYYVSQLTNGVVSAAHIEAHSRIISQSYMKRELIRLGGEMVSFGYDDSVDVFELLDQAETDLMSISLKNLKRDFKRIEKGVVQVLQRIDLLRNEDHTISGVTSGFPALDACTHGWQPTDLIILAARPSVGKTAFALNLARNAALDPDRPTPVGIFSLEMSELQLTQRVLAAESEISLEKISRGKLDDIRMQELYDRGVKKIAAAPIYIDDGGSLNIFELRSKARRMKQKHGVGMIIIDYLQLMGGEGKTTNREQEISSISRNLKKLAKDLEIPVIALSQLSREVEKRGKGQKIPQLSDLRESGAIEQDADIVMFLYRPPMDEVKENADLQHSGLIRIAKHRNGSLDDFVMKFYSHIQKWVEPEKLEPNDNKMSGNWRKLPAGTLSRENKIAESNADDDPELPF